MTKLENNDLQITKHNNAEIFDIAKKTTMDDVLARDNISKLNDQQHIKTESDVTKETVDGSNSPCLPPILKKTDEEVDEPIISRPIGLYTNMLTIDTTNNNCKLLLKMMHNYDKSKKLIKLQK